MFKKCKNCHIEKKLIPDNFSKRRTNKDGFDSECKECKKKRDAIRYEKKREEILKQKKEYYQMNKREIIDKQLKYYRENIEDCRKREYEWRKNNPLHRRLINEHRRTRELNATHTLTAEEWSETKEYFSSSCAYCGMKEEKHVADVGERLHHEHVIPLASGGTYEKFNVVPACRSCNSSKANRKLSEWYPKSRGYSKERLNRLELFFALKGVEKN